MPDPAEMTTWETAWAGVGQPVGEHESPAGPQATVLQMALVAAGIANDGVVMAPHVVGSVRDRAGRELASTRPKAFTTATDAATAEQVSGIMQKVVERRLGRAGADRRRQGRRQDRNRRGRQGHSPPTRGSSRSPPPTTPRSPWRS